MRYLVILIVVSACGRLSFDDAVGPVTVELHQGGDPVQGAEVVFQNADGTLAMVITTDVAGIATQDVARHSLVTVIRSRDTANGTNYDIETIVGLELNDRISRGPDFDPWFGAGDLVVSLPGSVTNATSYDIEHGCSIDTLDDPSMTDTKTRPTACAPIGGVAVLAIARDVDGNPLAFGDATDLTLVPGGAVMAPMSAWSTDWQPVQIGVSLAAGSAEASVHTEELQHGIAYAATDYGIPEVAPTVQVDAVRPKGFADAFGIEAVATQPNWISQTGIYRRVKSTASSFDIDLADALPPLATATVTATADPSRPIVEVSPWSPLGKTDAALIQLAWTVPGAVTADNVRWTLTVPPGTLSYQLPELPESLAMLRPTETTLVDTEVSAGYYRGDFIGGFAGVRQDGWWFRDDSQYYLPDELELSFTRIGDP